MSFISNLYALFLISILGIYWTVQQKKIRMWALLIASVVFYGSLSVQDTSQAQYIPLLIVLSFINFRLGLVLGANTSPGKHAKNWRISNEQWRYAEFDWNRRRLKLLWFGIALNVLLLFGFKYLPLIYNFIFRPATNNGGGFKLIAPLGISFFTFECIAYLIDTYRGSPATRNFVEFAAYKLFFAKLISGPLVRYHAIAEQFNQSDLPTTANIAEGLWLIARGAVKKAILADHLGVFVDLCFGNLQRAGSTDIWLATVAYGLQLYLDFSGYVDIARGTAMLFGLVLPENFDFPYFSTNIADFWRRWHMTLGDWLRNYLYFPLGGSRQGLTRTCLNLTIVMVICGIWHGAALGFVVWGFVHGLALVVHRLTDVISDRVERLEHFWQNPLGIAIAWFLTQLFVFTSWIWFRLPNLQDSWWAINHLLGQTADEQFYQKVYVDALHVSPSQLSVMLIGLFLLMAVVYAFNRSLKLQFNWYVKLLFVPLSIYAVWVLAPEGSLPYIYFDF